MARRAGAAMALAAAIAAGTPEALSAKSAARDAQMSAAAYAACVEYGREYGICPELLMAVIETESGGNPAARNGSCVGLMQVSERWHAGRMERLGVASLYDERGNVLVGADYLAELLEECGGEAAYALSVYHGESDARSKAARGAVPPYAEKILRRSAELERLHGK